MALAEAVVPAEETDLRGESNLESGRRRLIDDLTRARDASRDRLSTVLEAMENVRIGLLRLRAGLATEEQVTAELGRAEDLSHQIEAELEMQDALG